jgi:TRAP-type C4-dicarboxylate transport system substrate-binding protein
MRKYFRCLSGCGLLLLFAVGMATPALAGPAKIKVALVAPEGSTWVKVLREMAADVKTRTAGEVDFLIYAGGVSGDEIDVLRKMRINRIQAAGFSGVGLGVVLPEVRVLEAPLLFRNDAEVDAVREQMFAYFARALFKKGFVLLGFTEGGWVYLFSQEDLSKPAAFGSIKMWVWEGDRVAETFLHNFGIRTTPLHIAEVNTGLERHMIDSFYSPAMAAVAFQWYAHMRFVLDYPMADSTAALVMTKRAFTALSAEHQAIVKDSARQYCRKLVELTRDDNRKAIEVMKAQGIRFVSPTSDQLKTFRKDAEKTYRQSIPQLYSQTLFNRIEAIVRASRGSARSK